MKKLIIALFLVAMLSMSAFAAVDSFREEFLQCMDGITGSPVRAEPPDPDSFREDVSRCLDGAGDPPGDLEPIGPGLQG